VLVVILIPYAYPWSSYDMNVPTGCSDWCVGFYSLLPMDSHMNSSGSIKTVNRNEK
jgi:hypothetical protein